jgi:hypothetical protein
MHARKRYAFSAIFFAALLAQTATVYADAHMLVLGVEAEVEEDRALAQLADMMIREAVVETPAVSLIEWTPTRETLVGTCQTAQIDESCLDAVAARFHADYILLPRIERHEDQAETVRHIEARLFDAREGVLGDPACAVVGATTDPEVALALVEVLFSAMRGEEDHDDAVELDASEGRSLRRVPPMSAHASRTQAASRPSLRGSSGLVPSASPCDSLSALVGRTSSVVCEGDRERDPAPEALTVLDGAGPSGYAALPEGEDHIDHEGHDDRIVDRMLERVRLSGRFSRGGVRVGAKIQF